MAFEQILIGIVLNPSYTCYYSFNVTYYNLKQILQDKRITIDNEQNKKKEKKKEKKKASFTLFNQCFV